MEHTPTKESAVNKSTQNDLAVYLAAFDSFSADKSAIESETGIAKTQVSKSLKRLEEKGLVSSVDVNGESQGAARRGEFQELQWQAIETYDSISRDEAIAIFNRAYGLEIEETVHAAKPVEATITPDTPEPTATKAKKVPLTNSQRRALLKLAASEIHNDALNDLSRKPLDYFVQHGLAVRNGNVYALTAAGSDRAADIDAAKYGA